jgi:hypothetical protein
MQSILLKVGILVWGHFLLMLMSFSGLKVRVSSVLGLFGRSSHYLRINSFYGLQPLVDSEQRTGSATSPHKLFVLYVIEMTRHMPILFSTAIGLHYYRVELRVG